MIKLNDNKTKSNLLKLINREISFIDASLAYQRSLNKEVLLCMNLITQNSEVIETAMEFSKNYEALNNVMALLKKSTFNIDSLEALLSQLYEIKNNESNVVMTNNIQTTAKKELSSTMTTMEKLVQTSYEEGDSSELLTNLVAALTSTKLSGNTNFYILRNENISFKSDSGFEINDGQIIKISKSKKDIHREKINNYQCYTSVVSLDNYEGVKNASMVFVTNTRNGTDNLVNSNVILMVIILICMIVSVVFSVKLSKSISNQIMKACAYANEVGNGIFTNKIEGQSNKEIEDLYKSLNHMAAKLKANDENQKSFYQNISHEFRNPLMSIQGYAEGIESGMNKFNG